MQRRQRMWGRRGFSRREMLKGLGLSAAAMPFVPLLESQAEGEDRPRRLIVFCTTTGMTGRYPGNWAPNGGTNNFSLSPILQPLAGGDTVHGVEVSNLVDDCLFFQGIDMASYYDSPANGGHPRGMGNVLTASPLESGGPFGGGGPDTSGWGTGISVDQAVANAIGKDTPFPSLELGVDNFGGTQHVRYVLSYRGRDEPLPVVSNPYAVFDRIFADLALDPQELAKLRAERLSVLDYLHRDLARLEDRIGVADKRKVDDHLDAVRGIEQRLASSVGTGCETPTLPDGINPNADAQFPTVGRLQMDMIVAAMACGMTNVASLMWGEAPYMSDFSWVPGVSGTRNFHQLSHAGSNDASAQDQLQAIARWYTQRFAYLVQRLKSIPEGDGTMLDNSLVIWVTENSKSNGHSARNMPYVIAGKAGGALQTGRYLRYDGVPHNQMMVSICQAMGMDVEQFGDPRYGSGGLAGLV